MLILSYLVCYLEIIAVWKNQIEIFDTFFVIWVESTAKVYGQPLVRQFYKRFCIFSIYCPYHHTHILFKCSDFLRKSFIQKVQYFDNIELNWSINPDNQLLFMHYVKDIEIIMFTVGEPFLDYLRIFNSKSYSLPVKHVFTSG